MVKVISLSNEAYAKLKGKKTGNKSFSDVVIELIDKKKEGSIMDFFGVLKDDKEALSSFEKAYRERKNVKLRALRF